jgi:NTE family protein
MPEGQGKRIDLRHVRCYREPMVALLRRRRRKLGLALGGGAARGLAHIGVLKALEEESIPIHYVAGTSVGSLIGVLHCCGYPWREILRLAREIDWADVLSFSLPHRGLVRTEKLERLVDRLVRGKRIEELATPFRAVAVDISRGETVVFQEGPAAKAVRASCSIPAVFEPTEWQGRVLVDGGLMNDVPADVVRAMGADIALGVDLSTNRLGGRAPENILEVVLFSVSILMRSRSQPGLESSDILVQPDLKEFALHDLKHLEQMVARGEEAMRAQLPRLRSRLRL